MEESKDFIDVDLDNVRISNILENQKENDKESPKIEDLDEKGKELPDNEKKDLKEIIINEEEVKKKINFCESYICAFIVYFVQSLISIGCFYLYYIFNFAFTKISQLILVEISLFLFLIIFSAIIYYFSTIKFHYKHKEKSKYILFILINLYKIIFEICIYLIIVYNQVKDPLDFSYFKGKAFWKISICSWYIMMIVYSYFKKDKNSISIIILDVLAFFNSAIFFILFYLFLNANYEYVNALIFPLTFEIIDMSISIMLEDDSRRCFEEMEIEIDWRVNRIDYIRSGFILIPLFLALIKCCNRSYC